MDATGTTLDAPLVLEQRGSSRAWVSLRLVLLGLWLVAAAAGYVLHERPATLGQLYASVAAGDVTSVRLVGGLVPGATGSAKLEVHWRSGGVPRVVTTTVVRQDDAWSAPSVPEGSVTTDDVAAEIAARDPSVRVVQAESPSGVTFSIPLLGGTVPVWAAVLALGVCLVAFCVLVAGPEPWRATRWAWFWLCGSPWGLLGFLLLSGPTPGLRGPRQPARRLTGGWAFLLGAVLPR